MNLVTLLRIEETYRLIEEKFIMEQNSYYRIERIDHAKHSGDIRKTLRERRLAESFSCSKLSKNVFIFTFRVSGFHCSAKWDVFNREFLLKEVRFSASLKKNSVLQ